MLSLIKRMFVVSIVLLMCMSLTANSFAADKVAYVNIDKLFDDYQKTLDLNEKLDKEIATRQTDRDKMVEAIRKMKDELVLLTDENKKVKQDEIDEQIRTLQGYDEKTREELAQKRNDYMREILMELDEEVKKYGSEKGYEFIYNGRLLLYQDEKFDITDKVLAKVNQSYKK